MRSDRLNRYPLVLANIALGLVYYHTGIMNKIQEPQSNPSLFADLSEAEAATVNGARCPGYGHGSRYPSYGYQSASYYRASYRSAYGYGDRHHYTYYGVANPYYLLG